MPKEALIRLVLGPEGTLVPDLAEKLPGRGVWVTADGELLEAAEKNKGLIKGASRSLKTGVKPRSDSEEPLSAQIAGLLRKRLLDRLGLIKKAGELVTGFDKIGAALGKGVEPALLIEADDAGPDGRRKLQNRLPDGLQVAGFLSREELSEALGLENVVHCLVLKGGGAEKLKVDLSRARGFLAGDK